MYFLRNFHKIYIPMLSQSKCGGNRDNKKRCKRYIYRIVCTYIKLGILRLWRIQKQVSSSHHLNRVIFKSAFFEMISFHLSITAFLLLDYERILFQCQLITFHRFSIVTNLVTHEFMWRILDFEYVYHIKYRYIKHYF